MSSIPHATPLPDAARVARQPPRSRFAHDLGVRTVVGVLLALLGIAVTLAGSYVFAGFVALAAAACTREWHRMISGPQFLPEWAASGTAIAAALLLTVVSHGLLWPLAVLAAGVLAAATLAGLRGVSLLASGFGVLYVGIPSWCLVVLRQHAPDAAVVVLGMLMMIWTADTGALLAGKALGGPKLLPALSPNKTWAGLGGGLALPALFGAVYVAALGGHWPAGLAAGFVVAAAGHAGDLFESWIKRRVGRKDSGELIPGHGGVLDRLDSTLSVAPVVATLIFLVGVFPWFGVPA